MPRRTLIVGASSTLGQALAALLHLRSEEVWLTYRREEKRALLSQACPRATLQQVDVLEPADVDSLRTRIADAWGGVDGLVFACGLVRNSSSVMQRELSAESQ